MASSTLTARPAPTAPAVRGLLHPITLAALAAWIVNDHVLKGLGPGWLTGKLSDVACLMVVPWMPLAAYALLGGDAGPSRARRQLWASCAAAGLVMATINVSEVAAWCYQHGLAALQWPVRQLAHALVGGGLAPWRPVQLTMDPTDLWTLPALAVPLWLAREGER